ncbi:hypothetical protein B0H13DRAFT_2312685 [Mycena leptocephala]|nr:hypothetical protein B0H13DRAFT_2312685 [Mycena leptocephala]
MAQMDAGMDISLLHNDREALRVAIIAGVSLSSLPFFFPSFPPVPLSQSKDKDPLIDANKRQNFLRKIDGSSITLAYLLQHLAATRVHAMLLGPESDMWEYASARRAVEAIRRYLADDIFYCHLFIKLHLPVFLHALRPFSPHVIHLVERICLGVQALIALQILFPSTSIVTSHHMNLPTYAEIFEYPYSHYRTWQIHAYLHSFAR